jgi:prepilin-type N-terminal cleavage/methylation domain-containing protein
MVAQVATMTSRVGIKPSARLTRCAAFTLIELIVVLALLSIVIAIGGPRLAKFFHGQVVQEEAQRLLALTRYGQSRAASEGSPMVLWMNPVTGAYGLRPQTAANDGSTKPPPGAGKDVALKLGDGLKFQFAQGGALPQQEASIIFAPDGSIMEGSMQQVQIQQDDGDWSAIAESPNHLNYVTVQKTNGRSALSW